MDIVPAHASDRDAAELRRLPLSLMLLRVGFLAAAAAALWLLLR